MNKNINKKATINELNKLEEEVKEYYDNLITNQNNVKR